MKISVYLDNSGLEKVAKGETPYYWDFSVRLEEEAPPKSAVCVLEKQEFILPSRETAARIAVEVLRAKKQAIYAEAEQDARLVEERIQNLLALEGPTS